MKLLGIDGGFSNVGWCLATYKDGLLQVDDMGVIRTEKTKTKTPDSVDNVARAQRIAEYLEALVLRFDPDIGRTEVSVQCICSEAMSHPPHASTAAKLSLTWGVIATLAYMTSLPVLQRTPQTIKFAVTGSKKASKADMLAALSAEYREIPALLAPWPATRHEHMVDALGAIVACLDDNAVKMFANNRNRRVAR